MEDLNIAILQIDLAWENPQKNQDKIEQLFQQLDNTIDLVLLPEMFTTGFSTNAPELAEPMNGATIRWLKECSDLYQIAICGSLIISDNGKYFNRLVFVEPSGMISFYDKRHLFTMGNEALHYQKGSERLIIQYKGWRICPLICYDLRFPVWSRNQNEYDLLVYVANWPQSRSDVWNTLLKARAIENQCYVAGVNRIGKDGMEINYSGESHIFDSKGQQLANSLSEKEELISASLSFQALADFRLKFPVLNDADDFLIISN